MQQVSDKNTYINQHMQHVSDKKHIIRSKQFQFGALDSKSEIGISTTNLSTCGLAIGDLCTNY